MVVQPACNLNEKNDCNLPEAPRFPYCLAFVEAAGLLLGCCWAAAGANCAGFPCNPIDTLLLTALTRCSQFPCIYSHFSKMYIFIFGTRNRFG